MSVKAPVPFTSIFPVGAESFVFLAGNQQDDSYARSEVAQRIDEVLLTCEVFFV
jgi:hypothetical protein